jgi:hypothetical protein
VGETAPEPGQVDDVSGEAVAAQPSPFYCPGCGARYQAPGVCTNMHQPIEVQPDNDVAPAEPVEPVEPVESPTDPAPAPEIPTVEVEQAPEQPATEPSEAVTVAGDPLPPVADTLDSTLITNTAPASIEPAVELVAEPAAEPVRQPLTDEEITNHLDNLRSLLENLVERAGALLDQLR